MPGGRTCSSRAVVMSMWGGAERVLLCYLPFVLCVFCGMSGTQPLRWSIWARPARHCHVSGIARHANLARPRRPHRRHARARRQQIEPHPAQSNPASPRRSAAVPPTGAVPPAETGARGRSRRPDASVSDAASGMFCLCGKGVAGKEVEWVCCGLWVAASWRCCW